MTTMLIANNCTRENGQFMGDQLCYIKVAYLFVLNEPSVDHVIMSMSPGNEMDFLWRKFIDTYNVEVIHDSLNPGDNEGRWVMWNKWRADRKIEGIPFDHYRELYLRIHGGFRQAALCGLERGLGRRNIFEYMFYGQEHMPEGCNGADWYDDSLIYHPPLSPERDVYISPHCKTQGNITFTFDYWTQVVQKLIDAGITATVGYDGYFCEHLLGHPLYKKHWGDHKQWVEQICKHKIVACGNTGSGWIAAACGVPLFTMEPPNSQMPDHRYRECGLRNIVEVMDTPDPAYCAKRLIEEVNRVVVMTTGCYDVLHAGHIRHLERSKALGTRLVVAMNSDKSVRRLKGPARPVNPQNQRKAVLEALRCVDEVRVCEEPLDVLKELKPSILTNGFGYTPDTVVGKDLVESWGGKVVVTCFGDASNEPSTTKIVRKLLRLGDIVEICRVGSRYSVNPYEKLRLMADEFLKVVHLAGDVADLGAYRGGTSLILRRLAPEKRLYLFDTWNGTPFNDELCHHKKGEWPSSLEECQSIVGKDKLTIYFEGIFPYVVENQIKENAFCFVYVDMDTYQSTCDAINYFWPKLVPGGVLLLDDYGWEPCAGVKKAVEELLPPDLSKSPWAYKRSIVDNLYTCVVTKISEIVG